MADFNGLWKVKIREKLLLEATSDISKIVFSSLPHFSSPPPPSPFFPLLISVSSLRLGFSLLSKPVLISFFYFLFLFLRDSRRFEEDF